MAHQPARCCVHGRLGRLARRSAGRTSTVHRESWRWCAPPRSSPGTASGAHLVRGTMSTAMSSRGGIRDLIRESARYGVASLAGTLATFALAPLYLHVLSPA